MKISISKAELKKYTEKQLLNFFPDGSDVNIDLRSFNLALERVEFCFSKIKLYTTREVYFNHLHSDQYLTYLWILSSQLWKDKCEKKLYEKIYYLNKCLHAFDCLYNNNLPEVFYIAHGIGTVLGKASYGNYLFVNKGVTVGANRGVDYPVLEDNVSLGCDATVIGKSKLKSFSICGAGVCLFNQIIPENKSIIRDNSGKLILIDQKEPYSTYVFF